MHLRTALLLTLLALVASCASDPQRPGKPDAAARAETVQAGEIRVNKSPNDDRDYRYLTLPNDLRVLLVSDHATDLAAASLVVLRGSNDDPDGYLGLAHFLEHMLFIGTEKYPQVDEYQTFISANGGSSNAYTGDDHTNFFFDVKPEAFQPAMDRFAQFFISPLLDPAYVDREKNAVNSEYQMQIKDDGWRGNSALKEAMNPMHPGARFNIGNLDTLGEGVQGALQQFFQTHYSADQMILVALSNESLDSMEAWVKPMFSAVPNHQLGPVVVDQPAFMDTQLPMTVYYKPIKELRKVSYTFPIPPTEPYYRQKPATYITNLLGHEGEGSLHQLLTDRGWIESLGASSDRLDNRNAFIGIEIKLTEAGAQHIDEITDALFSYIDLLERNPPEAWRYREQAVVADLGFRFQEHSSATGFVYRTGPMLALFPPEDVLAAPYLMEEFNPQLIQDYLAYLTPANLVMEVVTPDVTTDAVERWFDAPYRIAPGAQQVTLDADTGLALPERNPFLPEHLDLLPNDGQGPRLAENTPELKLWLDTDTEFNSPRANVYLTLGVRNGLVQPRDLVLAQLYRYLVNDALNEHTYPAMLAGLGYQIGVNTAGFELQVGGYSDKQPQLLDAVLKEFLNLRIDPARFAVYKDQLAREWSNFINERPYTQTYSALDDLLVSGSWPPATLVGALATLTPADLAAWRKARLNGFAVKGLAHGNLNQAFMRELTTLLRHDLPLKRFALTEPTVAPVNEALLLNVPIDHDDASIVLYVQDPDSSFAQRGRSALATQLLRQAYFSSLRTDQQLGYVVAVTNRTLYDRGGLAFVVQSPVASPAALEQATELFMAERLPAIAAMSDAEFEDYRAGLIVRLTEKDKNLNERSQRYWNDLTLDVETFDSNQQIAAVVAGLTRADMTAYLNGVAERLKTNRLLVFSSGKFDDVPSEGRRIDSVSAFKQG